MAQSATAPSAASSPGSGYLLAALGSVLFSTKAIFIKLAYGTGAAPADDAITLLALRMAFSLPIYVVIGALAWRDRSGTGRPLPTARQFLAAVLVGVLGYYVASYLDFAGLIYLTAQLERLILYTYPFFVMLLGALFFGGRVTGWGVASLVLAYFGIGMIFLDGATAAGEHTVFGALLVLGAAFTFALYQLIAKPLITAMGSRIFTCVAMSGACVAVLAHYATQASPAELLELSGRIVALGAILAIFATVVPSFMLNAALDRVGPQAVAVVGTLSPTATIVMAIAFLGEPFGWADALGTTLVMAGVGLFTWRDSRKP
jgi:drug/metabolite transporter (DMT)-like permease